MSSKAVRMAQWLGFVSDLLVGEPRCALPHEGVFDQLLKTFSVDGVAYNWAGPDRQPGMITRPLTILEPLGDQLGSWRAGELLQRHPLACWYLTTGDIRPTTIDRVPTSMVSAARREPVMRCLRQVGLEQQLSISFRLGPAGYDAYVLGRHGSDFSDDDVAVAGHVQRALIGLCRHTEVVAQLRRQGAGMNGDVGLTSRELCILGLLAAGHSTQAIAHRLLCSPRTVHKHLEHVYRKLAVRDRLNAVRVARASGLV